MKAPARLISLLRAFDFRDVDRWNRLLPWEEAPELKPIRKKDDFHLMAEPITRLAMKWDSNLMQRKQNPLRRWVLDSFKPWLPRSNRLHIDCLWNPDGTVITERQTIISKVAEAFSPIFFQPPEHRQQQQQPQEKTLRDLVLPLDKIPFLQLPELPEGLFNQDSIWETIQGSNKATAPGPDWILPRHIVENKQMACQLVTRTQEQSL